MPLRFSSWAMGAMPSASGSPPGGVRDDQAVLVDQHAPIIDAQVGPNQRPLAYPDSAHRVISVCGGNIRPEARPTEPVPSHRFSPSDCSPMCGPSASLPARPRPRPRPSPRCSPDEGEAPQPLSGALSLGGGSAVRQARTLTARAMTSPRMTSETMDWRVMTLLAQGVSGMTSVGLKAVELVNPR